MVNCRELWRIGGELGRIGESGKNLESRENLENWGDLGIIGER